MGENVASTTLLMSLAPALLTLALGLMLGRLPYGSSMGVRTQRTLQGETHWRYAHGLGARALMLGAMMLALLSRIAAPRMTMGTMAVLWLLALLVVAWVPPRKPETMP